MTTLTLRSLICPITICSTWWSGSSQRASGDGSPDRSLMEVERAGSTSAKSAAAPHVLHPAFFACPSMPRMDALRPARAARRFSRIVSSCCRRIDHVTAVGLFAASDRRQTIPAAEPRSTQEQAGSRASGRADPAAPRVPASIQKLPAQKSLSCCIARPLMVSLATTRARPRQRQRRPRTRPAGSGLRKPRAVVAPLAPEHYKVQFTVGRETFERLRRAQDLMRHSVPRAAAALWCERALTLILIELDRVAAQQPRTRPRGRTGRPRAGSRRLPARRWNGGFSTSDEGGSTCEGPENKGIYTTAFSITITWCPASRGGSCTSSSASTLVHGSQRLRGRGVPRSPPADARAGTRANVCLATDWHRCCAHRRNSVRPDRVA